MKAVHVPRLTVATPTPFTADGKVDTDAITLQVHWLKEQGVTSIIAGGTTGEFAGLTAAERLTTVKCTRTAFENGNLFGNVSACCVADAIKMAKQQIPARPDALLLLPPYYHAPFSTALGHAGVEAFFVEFFEQYKCLWPVLELEDEDALPPIFLYSFGLHTQQPVSVETYGRLAKRYPKLLGGIKASAVTVEEGAAYQAAAPSLTVMIGNGRTNLPALRAGLCIVSGDCCGVAWALTKLVRLHEAGKAEAAERIQAALLQIWRDTVMDGFDEVPAVKAAFESAVGTGLVVRPPLMALGAKDAAKVAQGMRRLREAVDAAAPDTQTNKKSAANGSAKEPRGTEAKPASKRQKC